MKLKLNLIFFVMLGLSVRAQELQLFTASEGKSIRVKWLSKNLNPGSYDLFRKTQSGSWEKINPQPIAASPVILKSELNSAKNPFPKDSAYAMYVEYKNNKETNANKQAYADYTLAMAAVFDNKLATHMGVFYEDQNVESGQKYQYKLALPGSQKELAVSGEIAMGDQLDAPSGFKAQQQKQALEFDWKHSEHFICYNLYRNGSKVNTDPILANLEGKIYLVSYQDKALKPGRYSYVLKGVSYLNTESKPSAELVFEVKDQTPPPAIKSFKAERKSGEILLQWAPSADKDLKGYNLYKSADKGKTFQKINPQIITDETVRFTEKLAESDSGTFQYYVEAEDLAGNKTPPVKASVFVPDHQPPAMPKSFVQKAESGKISLSWSANTEKDLAGYRIYRGLRDDDENSMLLLNVQPQIATTFIDTFAQKASTKFIYKVAAIDKAFNESPKVAAWVQLPDSFPPAAPILTNAALNGNEAVLRWNIVNDAILGYDVYRVVDDKKTKVNPVQISGTDFTDKSPGKGQLQYYVVAIDSAGLESKPSNSRYLSNVSAQYTSIKLLLGQEAKTKKVQIEIAGIEPEAVQYAKLYRKDGEAGFQVLPFQYSAQSVIDESSEPGKIYEYFVEVVDWSDRKFKSEMVSINNP